MAAFEVGAGGWGEREEEGRSEDRTNHEANKEGRLCLGQKMVVQVWGKKSYHR